MDDIPGNVTAVGGDLSFPLVVKPRWGSASIGIEYVEDERELELISRLSNKRLSRTMLSQAGARDPQHAILV